MGIRSKGLAFAAILLCVLASVNVRAASCTHILKNQLSYAVDWNIPDRSQMATNGFKHDRASVKYVEETGWVEVSNYFHAPSTGKAPKAIVVTDRYAIFFHEGEVYRAQMTFSYVGSHSTSAFTARRVDNRSIEAERSYSVESGSSLERLRYEGKVYLPEIDGGVVIGYEASMRELKIWSSSGRMYTYDITEAEPGTLVFSLIGRKAAPHDLKNFLLKLKELD